MTIDLGPDLEIALGEQAKRQGISPETLAQNILREKLATAPALPEPRDEWERQLRALAIDCGVSPPNSAISREELYD